jgi:hypothetical protein
MPKKTSFTQAEKDALMKLEWKAPRQPDPRVSNQHLIDIYEIEASYRTGAEQEKAKRLLEEERKKVIIQPAWVYEALEEERKRQAKEKRRAKAVQSDSDSERSVEPMAVPIKKKNIDGVVYDTITSDGTTYVYKKGTRDYLGIMKLKRMADDDTLKAYVMKDVRFPDPLESDSDSD